MAGKTANAYVKIIVSSNIKKAMGDFASAHPKLAKFGAALKKVGVMGAIAFAAIGVAIAGVVKALMSAKRSYETYMQSLDDLQDVTRMSAGATSELAFQLRMSDVDAGTAAKAMGLFTKNLGRARITIKQAQREMKYLDKGSASYADQLERINDRIYDAGGAFTELGIDLQDANGNARSAEQILFEVRERLHEIPDAARRGTLAAQIFGRGWAGLTDWFDKSNKAIERYIKWTDQLGLKMSEQAMGAFQKYKQNQHKLEVGWEAIKVNAYAALVPLINDLMPKVIKLIWGAAGWMGRFRKLVEKKGWGQAFEEMVPGGKKVVAILGDAKRWWDNNRSAIQKTVVQVGKLLVSLGEFAKWVSDHKGPVTAGIRMMFDFSSYYKSLALILVKLQEIVSFIDSHATLKKFLIGGDIPIPKDAEGGIVTSPRLSITGEAGPEAIVPLTNPARAAEILDAAGLTGSTIVNVFLDGKLIEKQVTKRQSERLRRLERAYA